MGVARRRSLTQNLQLTVEIDRSSISINTKTPMFWLLVSLGLKYMSPAATIYPGKQVTTLLRVGHPYYPHQSFYCTPERFTPLRSLLLTWKILGMQTHRTKHVFQETSLRHTGTCWLCKCSQGDGQPR